MNWILTIVVGGIIGWLGSLVMKTDAQMGIVANVIVGIVGTSLGFWLAGVLGLAAYGAIAQWAVAIAGAAVLIFLLKAMGIFR
ncbi:MAG TPA: GlsB/YeaQ/YmgE family stress response membrane protein [Vicinamibacterales bacterium]|nr:GlsB/YeaQ/YmgE family stress response membrane protein [Vicinamibacterales bacterium]